jgi:hypothetical protein
LTKRTSYAANSVEDVSLITLIANPKQFDGHKVRVIGYLNLEFEGNCIYLHKEDYDQSISKNGLWVEMDRDSTQLPRIRQCVKKNVLMEGTFDANIQGHMGLNSGAIKNITRLETWGSSIVVIPPHTKKDVIHFPSPKHHQ